MDNFKEIKDLILAMVKEIKTESGQADVRPQPNQQIPVGISNRHIHLSQKELDILFGPGYELSPIKDLSQPGQYAAQETLTICGPKGAIEGVRILGPVRKQSQVEILQADGFKLGIKAPVRMSGDLAGSAPITLVGPKASVYIKEGAIVAQRHIHMTPADAKNFGVVDGQRVSIEAEGERGGRLSNVVIRVTETSKLDCHLDIEEANALGLNPKSKIIIK